MPQTNMTLRTRLVVWTFTAMAFTAMVLCLLGRMWPTPGPLE